MNSTVKPVCELEDFHVNKLMIEGVDWESSGRLSASYGFDYDLACRTDNPHLVKVTMRYSIRPNSSDPSPLCPYSIQTEVEGVFSFPEGTDEMKQEYLCRVNGLTILYGILRGEIANVTGSFKNGKFILPTVMMQDIVKEIEERKAKAREEKQIGSEQEKK